MQTTSQPPRPTRFFHSRQLFSGLAVAGIFVAFSLLLAFIARNNHEVPWSDEWSTSAQLALAFREGTLTFDALLAQHNEHRIFFTNLTTVILTAFTNWRISFEPFIHVVLASLGFLLLVIILRRAQVKFLPAAALLFALLVFSIRQGYNWYLGFQSCMYFLYFFYVAAVAAFSLLPTGWRALTLAGIFCFCATFSFGFGFMTWIVLFLCLWLFHYRHIKYFAYWCALTGITYLLYFYDFSTGPRGSVSSIFTLEFLQSVLSGLGGQFVDVPMGEYDAVSVVFGIVGLFFLCFNTGVLWWVSRQTRMLAPWLALAGFTLFSAALVSYGRAYLGLPQALHARYVTISHLLWLSSAALAFLTITQLRVTKISSSLRRSFITLNIVALVVCGVAFVNQTVTTWRLPAPGFDFMENCVLAFPVTQQPECLVSLFPLFDPALSTPETLNMLYERVMLLARYRLTIFALQEPGTAASAIIPHEPQGTLLGSGLSPVHWDHSPTRTYQRRQFSLASL